MASGIHRLTALEVTRAKPGMHSDGGGLWLRVQGSSRAWVFRYTSPRTGLERRMGLGSLLVVPLALARDQASAARKQVHAGIDPLDEKQSAAAEQKKLVVTFKMAAEACILAKKVAWRSTSHREQWEAMLSAYAYPKLGHLAVEKVGKAEIHEMLGELWAAKPKTASRLRGRVEIVLDYAKQREWRAGDNPAAWRGNLMHVFQPARKIEPVKHFAALRWQQMPEVMAKLREAGGAGALAVRFIALTAARSMECRGATWAEINVAEKVWTIPAERMKSGREHRVPLSATALEVLEAARPFVELAGPTGPIFPGVPATKPLSDKGLSKALHVAAGTTAVTIHGLRSTFRDWVAEETSHQPDVAEAALAHVVGDATRAAYQRGDLFEKRRGMMEEWAGAASPGDCTPLARGAPSG